MPLLRKDIKLGLATGAVLLLGGAGYLVISSWGEGESTADAMIDPLAGGAATADPMAGPVADPMAGDLPEAAESPHDAAPVQQAIASPAPVSDWSVFGGSTPHVTQTPVPGQPAPEPQTPEPSSALPVADEPFEPSTPDLNRQVVADAFATAIEELNTRNGEVDSTDDRTAASPVRTEADATVTPLPPESTPSTPAPAVIPEPAPTPSAVNETTHVVASGESFSSIAAKHYGDSRLFSLIQDANPGVNPNRLKIGQKLVIPARDVAEQSQAKTQARELPDGTPTHTVASGETLSVIANKRLGRSALWEEIYELNRDVIGDDPGDLKVGMVLKLPK